MDRAGESFTEVYAEFIGDQEFEDTVTDFAAAFIDARLSGDEAEVDRSSRNFFTAVFAYNEVHARGTTEEELNVSCYEVVTKAWQERRPDDSPLQVGSLSADRWRSVETEITASLTAANPRSRDVTTPQELLARLARGELYHRIPASPIIPSQRRSGDF